MCDGKWFVVKTKIRAEKKVNERLMNANFETYLPLLTTLKIWSDRKKKVSEPLIPSTLFVYTTETQLKNIYPIQGVSSILKYLTKPAIVHEHEINNMRILLQEGNTNEALEEISAPVKGQTVRVTRGPFQGLIATAVQTDQKFRIVVELESLGTGFFVNIPKSYVRKVTISSK